MAYLSRQFKAIVETLRAELGAIQKAIQQQKDAASDATKAAEKRRGEPVRAAIISGALGTIEEIKAETSQRDKEYYQQERLIKWTKRAFIAAAIYAGIAAVQGWLMQRTYKEIKSQTHSAEWSAYSACVNAQAAQETLIQTQNGEIYSYVMASSAAAQMAGEIDAGRATVRVIPDPPPSQQVGVLSIPVAERNEGRGTAMNFVARYKAVILENSETLQFDRKEMSSSAGESMLPEVSAPPQQPGGQYTPASMTIPVHDAAGAVVPLSSTYARDFFAPNFSATIYFYGNVVYSDAFGKHEQNFCQPIFLMGNGTSRPVTQNDEKCARYNEQNSAYTYAPAPPPIPPLQIAQPKPINCATPIRP